MFFLMHVQLHILLASNDCDLIFVTEFWLLSDKLMALVSLTWSLHSMPEPH